MIKKIVKKVFRAFGYEVAIKRKKKVVVPTPVVEKQEISLEPLNADPLNSQLHFELAHKYFENANYFAAFAELKTAESLGLDDAEVRKTEPIFEARLPNLIELNHNQYFRFKSLSSAIYINTANIAEKPTILDIGGGNGELASFIPDCMYCLVEPTVNGISGLELPFEDESFDLVVSCHVLEHIPFDDREKFLDQLVSKAKKGVILLNPIQIEQTLPKERMQLFIDITDAAWAKEHLECGLPTVDSIKEYAEKRNLKYNYTPNGTMTTSMALVFFDYLSANLDKGKYQKINRFFNTKYLDILNSDEFPNAGLFYLEK